MKKIIICIIISSISGICLKGQETYKTDSVEIINDYKDLYRYQNFYLSGQPTYEELQWLKGKNVTEIINLRSETENENFSESAFNEQAIAKDLGFEYHSLPIDGLKDFTPGKLGTFINMLKDDKVILVHCRSAGRATYFFMAYLIKAKGYSVNEAVKIGKSMKYAFYLENLLGTEISMEVPK